MGVYLVIKKHEISERLKQWWNRHRRMILYVSILVFSLIHVRNAKEFSLETIPFIPALVFMQFLLAIFASYIMVKAGIFYSIALHCMANLVPISLMVVARFGKPSGACILQLKILEIAHPVFLVRQIEYPIFSLACNTSYLSIGHDKSRQKRQKPCYRYPIRFVQR